MLSTKLEEAQAAIRKLIKDMKESQGELVCHSACNSKVNALKDRLRQAQGEIVALRSDPLLSSGPGSDSEQEGSEGKSDISGRGRDQILPSALPQGAEESSSSGRPQKGRGLGLPMAPITMNTVAN